MKVTQCVGCISANTSYTGVTRSGHTTCHVRVTLMTGVYTCMYILKIVRGGVFKKMPSVHGFNWLLHVSRGVPSRHTDPLTNIYMYVVCMYTYKLSYYMYDVHMHLKDWAFTTFPRDWGGADASIISVHVHCTCTCVCTFLKKQV